MTHRNHLALACLRTELGAWAEKGQLISIWWRDDDTTSESEGLSRILRIAAEHCIRLNLAVIPATMSAGLATFLSPHTIVDVLQHGFSHTNHEPDFRGRSEYGSTRSLAIAKDEIVTGRCLLEQAFTTQFVPVFVPPWNRMCTRIASQLPSLGFKHISMYGHTYPNPTIADALRRYDVHCDFVDWQKRESFDLESMAYLITSELSRRRATGQHGDGILGLLTHHLLHQPSFWGEFKQLISLLEETPAVTWDCPRNALGIADHNCQPQTRH